MMHAPPGRTLSRNDWPETTGKLTPSLKLCTSDGDLNPRVWDSNPTKTQIGTRSHVARTWPKPTVFQVRSHTWFQDLMKLRFSTSHGRKNSVRDKVIGKKWIYLERNTLRTERGPSQKERAALGETLHRQSVGISEGEKGTRVWGWSGFIG